MKKNKIFQAALVLAVAIGYGGWHLYIDRLTAQASVAFDQAMKAYQGRIAPPNPSEPGEPAYSDERARSQDAFNKFSKLADTYPSTNPGRLARYYAALCLEDLDRQSQALEELKKISGSSDKELAAMAQYQMAVVYVRTAKTDDAVKLLRVLADKQSVLVPRPLVLLELAGALRSSNPQEAANIYRQIQNQRQIRRKIAESKTVQRVELVERHPFAMTLIGNRRISKPVRHHPAPSSKRGRDDSDNVVASRRE